MMELTQAELFSASIILAVFSIVIVGLRCVARAMIRGFWIDDYLMIATQNVFIITCVLSLLGAVDGLGVRDQNIAKGYPGPKNQIDARQFHLGLVKTSIALALYRITNSKVIKCYLWFIIGLSIATSFVILGVLLSICSPFAGLWNYTITRSCAATAGQRINGVFIFSTISAIVTDFSCAIIPYIIIWRLQMPKKTKILLASVLGLSFVACAATLVRLKYIPRYTARTEFLWGLADPYIWTLIEIGIAIIIGSVPALRPLLKKIGIISTITRSRTTTATRKNPTGPGTGRMPSHRGQGLHRSRLTKNGSETYELLDAEVGMCKGGGGSRLTTGEGSEVV
ncbi:hypothetical protein B9Z65_8871 [Elsinoe australis]|uniref:Rhodopsin domain-containing protein n=1 Tax=Elsinoe australis TaxID=40998 RepID=A0A2P7YF12_9PEZI|nr:hypothetical protein B9Z65_8871 [Elsinoe australis]